MKSLNQIVSENAKLALDEAQAREQAKGGSLSKRSVSAAMAQRLPARPNTGQPWTVDSVDRQMRFLLEGKRRWNIDFIEAFCATVGIRPEDILSADYGRALKRREASSKDHLESAIGVEITAQEALTLIGHLRRELEHRPLHKLVREVISSILEAKDQQQADFEVSQLIRSRDVWREAQSKKAKAL